MTGSFSDKNLSLLVKLMRKFPFLILPTHSGLRQPIHISQLASVSIELMRAMIYSSSSAPDAQSLLIGGDSTLTYFSMVKALRDSLPPNDSAHYCTLLLCPKMLFYFFASPLLLCSPKTFEAILRIGANLSGFIPSYEIMKIEPQPFPVLTSW